MRLRIVGVCAPLVLAACAHSPQAHYVAYTEPKSGDIEAEIETFAKGPIKFQLAGSLLIVSATPKDKENAQAPSNTDGKPPKKKQGGDNGSGIQMLGKLDPTDSPATNDSTSRAPLTRDGLLASMRQAPSPVSSLDEWDRLRPQMSVVKVAAGGPLRALVVDDPFYYHSNLSPQYVPASYVLSSLGAAAEDNSIAVVNAVGSVASAAILLAALSNTIDRLGGAISDTPVSGSPPSVTLPFVIDLSDGVDGTRCGSAKPSTAAWRPIENSGWSYSVTSRGLSGGVKCETFFAKASEKGASFNRLFPVSACREVTITLRAIGANVAKDPSLMHETRSFDVTIADPSFVEGYLIPSKGSIAMPNICGANLTAAPAGSPSDLDVLAAIANQAMAIKKARAGGK